jgi:acetylornithine/LysW-gamma-L-lysine aminotransferase
MTDYAQIEDRYTLPLYGKRGLTLVRGEGATVWDSDGKSYIDCTAGQGVAIVGHACKPVVEAISRQAGTLMTCTGSFYNDRRAMLMEKLVQITPAGLDRVFLCNSGTETIEAALKFSRLTTGKTEIICAERGFHGRTFGSLSATHRPEYRAGFEPLVPGFSFVPYNDVEGLRAAVNDRTAAVLLEVVQGEGGIYPARAGYLPAVRELCDAHDVLLVIDEVQTGFGRTGKLFACEYHDLTPDILCLAKAMGGGFPVGAVLCSDKINVTKGKHGTTFGGNPLACAASLAAIDFIVKENLPEKAAVKGKRMLERLQESTLPYVREIRQIGLMIGIELDREVQPCIADLQNQGVLVLPAGAQVLRLLPPLVITDNQWQEVTEKLIGAIRSIEN